MSIAVFLIDPAAKGVGDSEEVIQDIKQKDDSI